MSYHLLLILALIPTVAASQTILAVADARYLSLPRAQTLSTESSLDSMPNEAGEILIPLSGWQRYRLRKVKTTGGKRRQNFVAIWKLDGRKDGRYFFVLEKLPSVDAKRFQATHKVLESSLAVEAACLENPVRDVEARDFGVNAFGQSCYSIYELLRAPHVR